MISRHHSPLVQPSNSGRASTWSIFAESAAESLSQMGTEVSSDRPGPAMRSNYPERASTTGNAGHHPPNPSRPARDLPPPRHFDAPSTRLSRKPAAVKKTLSPSCHRATPSHSLPREQVGSDGQ